MKIIRLNPEIVLINEAGLLASHTGKSVMEIEQLVSGQYKHCAPELFCELTLKLGEPISYVWTSDSAEVKDFLIAMDEVFRL